MVLVIRPGAAESDDMAHQGRLVGPRISGRWIVAIRRRCGGISDAGHTTEGVVTGVGAIGGQTDGSVHLIRPAGAVVLILARITIGTLHLVDLADIGRRRRTARTVVGPVISAGPRGGRYGTRHEAAQGVIAHSDGLTLGIGLRRHETAWVVCIRHLTYVGVGHGKLTPPGVVAHGGVVTVRIHGLEQIPERVVGILGLSSIDSAVGVRLDGEFTGGVEYR